MHQDALQALQHAPPLGVRAVVRQPGRAQHMQPLRPARDPEPGLVEMLHPAATHQQLAQPVREARPALSRLARHPRQRGRADPHLEQIPQHLGQTLLGQEMGIRQVHRDGRDPWPVLHRSGHSLRKPGPRQAAAGRAAAGMRLMLGHFRGRRGRQIEHLAAERLPLLVAVRQRRPAVGAMGGQMDLDPVRRVGLAQCGALVPGLPPRALPGAASPAAHPPLGGRLGGPVTGRRLAAVTAVEAQLAAQLLHLLLQVVLRGPHRGNPRPQPGILAAQPGILRR